MITFPFLLSPNALTVVSQEFPIVFVPTAVITGAKW